MLRRWWSIDDGGGAVSLLTMRMATVMLTHRFYNRNIRWMKVIYCCRGKGESVVSDDVAVVVCLRVLGKSPSAVDFTAQVRT